jgi:hypothetical protein
VVIVGCLLPQTKSLSEGTIYLENVQVEALPPDRGTAAFIAQTEGEPISGVEIKIDGVTKGFTDGEGKLKVEWLIAGEHSWGAIYRGGKISQGKFEIPEIVDAEFVDVWAIVRGEEYREGFKVNPFKESAGPCWTIKNTGTTIIDHYTIKVPSSYKRGGAMKIKLISPSIPSWLWEPFVGEKLLSCDGGREVIIKDGEVEMYNCYTGHPESNVIIGTPIPEEGIRPGEIMTLGYKPPYYIQWTEEYLENKGRELGTEMPMEVVDEEKGIAHVVIKEYKLGPFTFHNIKMELLFKGLNKGGTVSVELYIDDKLYDSHPWMDYEWVLN